ncbi:hypothetical protein [Bradyrhizobium sp. LMTR 3]|uniref:hypothetical protein n=1 Tax=Bradyrhizobium sp. LMTR 3 TaxID=189873 RepID=UPI000810556A|nr:hypothetical protein [Bradyrhizobium sp. LMTR 3]OCK56712.1 hypothetical protein LMTR3_13795 [Bradyrhizobium sp. LMTR 3]
MPALSWSQGELPDVRRNTLNGPETRGVVDILVVGGWIWAPKISNLVQSLFSGGPSVSMFADTNRIGRPETAPVVRSCIFKAMDLGPDANKMESSAAYFVLKAGSMQANVSAMLGKSDRWSENRTVNLANTWGQLASCIYALDDRELCDPDNRAAAVEATMKFFAYAKQTGASAGKPAISSLRYACGRRFRQSCTGRNSASHARRASNPRHLQALTRDGQPAMCEGRALHAPAVR